MSSQVSSLGHRVSGRAPLALLEEIKRVTIEQLSSLPDALYPRMEGELNRSLDAATERGYGLGGAQRDELMLLKVLRQRSASHAMRYREQLGQLFDPLAGRYPENEEEAGLRLVGEEELDFRLSGERMAEALASACKSEIAILDYRFRGFAALLGRAGAHNPVAPERLATALTQTFRDADLSPVLQTLLIQHYEAAMGKLLPPLYRRIDELLRTTGGVDGEPPAHRMPAAGSVDAVRGQGAGSPAQQAQARAQPFAASPANARTPDDVVEQSEWFRPPPDAQARHSQLRELLHAWRDTGGAPLSANAPARAGGASAGDAGGGWHVTESAQPHYAASGKAHGAAAAPSVDASDLARVASLLQTDVYEPFEQALAGGQRLHEAIREHMGDGARRLGMDLGSARIARADADAIDLVGLLFEAMAASQGDTPEARQLFARLVMTYVRIALSDEQLFLRPGHPGKRLLDAVALSVEDNAGVTRQERELLQRAQQQVEKVVAEFNEDLAILETATNELQPLLAQQRRIAEVTERRARESVQGRERLLQARNQAASEVAQRLSGRSMTPVVARFLSRYWRHHYEQALLRGGEDSERVAEASDIANALVELDALAARPDGDDIADRLLALMPRLSQCFLDSGLDHAATQEWMAGIARAVAFPDLPRQTQVVAPLRTETDDTADAARADPLTVQRMSALRIGDWLRLADPVGGMQPVKVAWISNVTARLLLVDRRGQRKLVASPVQLAMLAGEGRLQVGGGESPFDRALQEVQDRLGSGQAG